MVEQGCAPLDRASFWLTMARTRPLVGSMATTVPFMLPSASIAAWRTIGSSPAVMSPSRDVFGERAHVEALVVSGGGGVV